MELKLKKGPQDLEARVLKQGLCCSCGACMGLCPYFIVMKEHVVLMEPCGLTEGRCYEVCPRTSVDLESLNRSVFGKGRDDYILGTHKKVGMSKTGYSDLSGKGQYGGTVSSLVIHGLESGAFDGALMAGTSDRYGLLPEPVLARSKEDVLAAAGSKYSACPTLKILDKSLRECDKIGVVGRPCQVTALRKRIACEPEIGERISLVIGLFCMWSLNYDKLSQHLSNELDLGAAKKVDIPYNRFVVECEDCVKEMDFEPIRELRNPTCDLCFDFTSEFADVSVGGTEWKEDWNTLIVRTDKGEAAVKAAAEAGGLVQDELPAERVGMLRQASAGKKKRVIDALENDSCLLPDYLVFSDQEKKAVKES